MQKNMSIEGVINNVLSMVVWPTFVGAVVIMLIYAGFLFLSSAGDPTKLTNARTAVLWAIVGIAVGILAYSVTGIIKTVLGE